MAKIGDNVIGRWKREREVHNEGDMDRKRDEFALRADGKLVKKYSVHHVSDGISGAGWHDWGWTRVNFGAVPVPSLKALDTRLTDQGFERVA